MPICKNGNMGGHSTWRFYFGTCLERLKVGKFTTGEYQVLYTIVVEHPVPHSLPVPGSVNMAIVQEGIEQPLVLKNPCMKNL